MSTQHQPYQVISHDGDIEFRFYPAAAFARVYVQGANLLTEGFRHLANYIFGGNQANQSIAMTIPVVLEPGMGNQEGHVSFYLTDSNAPKPNSSDVHIAHQLGRYAAAITVKGVVRQASLNAIAARLHATLTSQGRSCSPTPEFRYYTPPWQLFGRRSDVLFTLNDMPAINTTPSD
ncbi:MAG: heme-binding protein [Chloroflexales bacterium]|nr:heme-binding protein [Chloroflexales bacterium]